ncbi:MAG: porin [Rhodospirillales bacterium]|nr:porin [Rhodospirillales bacterium]
MRRLLLTTAAALGVAMGLAGAATAQEALAKPPPGVPGPMFGVGGLGVPPAGAAMAAAPGVAAPNSFVVHFNGRLNWYAGVEGSSADQHAGSKLDPLSFQGYIRLYPGFDAVAANGLKYGVVAEIRMPGSNFTGAGISPGATSGNETLFWRRAYGYVGTDQLGTLRFGMGDGPSSIFVTGTFEGFNDSGWNGDVPGFAPSATFAFYPFPDVGATYTSDKIVYLSPVFSGFQFGVGFEPNTSNLWNAPGCAFAATTCNALSASPVPGGSARRRNTIDVGGSYAQEFDGVGIDIGGAYMASEHVSAPGIQYNGLSVVDVGATVSYAGLTVGGNVNYGQQNYDYSLQPRSGVDSLAFMLGGQYQAGPYVIGASYFKSKFAGGSAISTPLTPVARAETDQGVAAGGTYDLAPGMALYLSYLYGQRHQAGYDFYTGGPGTAGNNTHVNIFALGTVMKW